MSEKKTISLEQFRQRKITENSENKIPGILVWLHCPGCNTFEYSEILAPNGRTHKCGSLVEEVEVDVDLRAELTIARLNLEKINTLLDQNKEFRLIKLVSKSLDNALVALKKSEEVYLERVLVAGKRQIVPYPGDIDELRDKLSVKEINKLGLLISEFRFEPEKRFTRGKNQ
ncbi:MAG: hypothetical protein GY866_20040 [Proteobacteria bacterium]|nr:hypothetical protein [Pseudomonadota bacterium]